MDKLKRCRLCGSNNVRTGVDGRARWAECRDCEFSVAVQEEKVSREGLGQIWNTMSFEVP